MPPLRRRRELVVLGAGLLSSAALAWAALAPWGDAEVAGQLELERRTAQARDLVQLAWGRLAGSAEGALGRLGEGLRLGSDELAWTSSPGIDRYRRRAVLEPFDVLLTEVDRAPAASALGELEEALAAHPDAALRPEGLLRAIQLAARAGDGDALARHLAAALELAPDQARIDTSYRLLAALAAAPALAPEERVELQRGLAEAWRAGILALPRARDAFVPGEEGGYRYRPDPRLEALDARLAALGPEPGRSVDGHGRRARALARLIGNALGAPPDTPTEVPPEVALDGRWHVLALPAGGLATLLARDAALEVHLVEERALLAALALEAGLPPAFGLRGAGDAPAAAPAVAVGEPVALEEGVPAVQLTHADPGALVRGEADRLRLLRLGFAALAVLSAVASLATLRALRRERRLAELKSGFIAGVSHDLRSPLASILLMAENLEAGRVSGDAASARYFGAIRREAQRLRRLVDDVLDFSRIERGEGTRLALEEVDLPRLVDELAAETAERVERAGGTLAVERGALPAHAELDAEAVRRSVWNLVDNALAHSGSVDVTLAARVEDDRWLVLEVADRGRGVPADEREALFRPFARLDGANGAAGGTGLGLAIVRALARAHGGEATLEPHPAGPGTLARLRLALNPRD